MRQFALSRKEVIAEMVRQGWHYAGLFALKQRVRMYEDWHKKGSSVSLINHKGDSK